MARGSIFAAVLVVVPLALICTPRNSAQSTNKPKIVQSEIKYVSPVSGKQMYEAYCASCHGVDGVGNATAAAALQQSPTDLRTLSMHNGGNFPAYHVRDVLLDSDAYHDRAGDAMPVWIPAFQSLQKSHPDLVRLRVYNLVTYLQTIQAQPRGTDLARSVKPQ
jgi:hypothetical protein